MVNSAVSMQLTLVSSLSFFILLVGQAIAVTPCENVDYQQNTLKLIRDQAIADSFIDLSKYNEISNMPDRFEASDVVLSENGHFMYVVFDNSYQVGAFCTPLGRSFNCTDRLMDWPDSSMIGKKSGFEGMTYNPMDGTYFIAQEALETNTKKIFKSNVFEVYINPKDVTPIRIKESCSINWEFTSDNKGFEGLEFAFHRGSGKTYLLGLCEANKCDHKSTSTNDGRVVTLEKTKATAKNPCSWEPVGTFDLPSSVYFEDYSAISIYRQQSFETPAYVAVTSQENSQVWIGVIRELETAPFFDLKSLNKKTIYDLPRTTEEASNCQIKYCNVEGVAWRGKNQLILVSDKAKSDQDIHCIEKDQSIHYLALPEMLSN